MPSNFDEKNAIVFWGQYHGIFETKFFPLRFEGIGQDDNGGKTWFYEAARKPNKFWLEISIYVVFSNQNVVT